VTSIVPQAAPAPAGVDWVPIWGYSQSGVVPTTQPSVRVYRSTAQSIPNATFTAMSFDTVRYDVGPSPHWVAGSPTRLTCQVAGTYAVWAGVQYNGATGGYTRVAQIYKNGSIYLGSGGVGGAASNAGGAPAASNATIVQLSIGDYVEALAYQDSGAALNTYGGSATSQHCADFSMALLGGMQGPPGAGVPAGPVVNGQWIKGSGGATVWAPITQADLPGPLQAVEVSTTDFNAATASGWYRMENNSTNAPAAAYFHLLVLAMSGGGEVRQTAYQLYNDSVYTRRRDNGTWTAWRLSSTNALAIEPSGWPGPCRVQMGQSSLGTVGAGQPVVVYVTLPVAWPNSHYAFLCSGWPGGHWNFGTLASLPGSLSQGMVAFRNDSAQQVTANWISMGY